MNGKSPAEGFAIDFELFISGNVFRKQRAIVRALESVASWISKKEKENCYLKLAACLSLVIDFLD